MLDIFEIILIGATTLIASLSYFLNMILSRKIRSYKNSSLDELFERIQDLNNVNIDSIHTSEILTDKICRFIKYYSDAASIIINDKEAEVNLYGLINQNENGDGKTNNVDKLKFFDLFNGNFKNLGPSHIFFKLIKDNYQFLLYNKRIDKNFIFGDLSNKKKYNFYCAMPVSKKEGDSLYNIIGVLDISSKVKVKEEEAIALRNFSKKTNDILYSLMNSLSVQVK